MKTLYSIAAATLLLGSTACNDEMADMAEWSEQPAKTQMEAKQFGTRAVTETSVKTGHLFVIDRKLPIATKEKYVKYADNLGGDVTIAPRKANNACDVHLEILPVYADGQDDASGDYYAVEGYIVTHNAELFRHDTYEYRQETVGYYMGNLGFDMQLLDQDGNAVSYDGVSFADTPQPESTCGETTYTSGYTFSINVNLSVGYKNGTFVNFSVLPGFKIIDKASRDLPDQVVTMSTDMERKVSYDVATENYEGGMDKSNIPSFAYNDQRIDFSFIWHVHHDHYCAKDNNEGHMKMRFNFRPQLFINALLNSATTQGIPYDYPMIGCKANMDYTDDSFEFDLPEPDRTPIGTLQVENVSTLYMTDITVWESGTYGTEGAKPVCSCDNTFGMDDSYDTLLHEGTYDYVFNMRNGDTGEIKSSRIIRNIEIGAQSKTVTNARNSEKL